MKQSVSCRKCLLVRLSLLLLWIGTLFWLSLTPSPPSLPSVLLSWDKLQHAGAYALLTLLAGRFISQWRPLIRYPWLYALLVAIILGGMVEILQGTLTRVRRAEWGDLIADAAGGLAVVVAAYIREHWLLRKSS